VGLSNGVLQRVAVASITCKILGEGGELLRPHLGAPSNRRWTESRGLECSAPGLRWAARDLAESGDHCHVCRAGTMKIVLGQAKGISSATLPLRSTWNVVSKAHPTGLGALSSAYGQRYLC